MNQNSILKPKQFIKMHGAGNSFIIIEHKNETNEQLIKLAMKLCDRNMGIGADTLLVISKNKEESTKAKYYMIVYNGDGSFAEMCGNGLRCFSACLNYLGLEQNNEFYVKTDNGLKKNVVYKQQNKYRVKIQMGILDQNQVAQDLSEQVRTIVSELKFQFAHLINFNVPHLVIYLQQMPTKQKIRQYGKSLQHYINANINFAKLTSIQQNNNEIYLQTYERGCGLTLACGTGACATYVVGIKSNLFKGQTLIRVQGGLLKLSIDGNKVIKDGPSQFICRGQYY